jgi:uncharacterized protein YndB with AHSA1/START domain
MANSDYGPSEEAVQKATGKSWQQWFDILNRQQANKMNHTDIARWISESYTSQVSPWWTQSITVGYEYYIGRRVKGQTLDAGFEVGVQKTINAPIEKVWQFITSKKGAKLWLGNLKEELELQKGATYTTASGATGEIRSVYPQQKLRLTWTPKGRDSATTVQIYMLCPRNQANKTNLQFHQEKLADANERQAMKEHWRGALSAIEKSI